MNISNDQERDQNNIEFLFELILTGGITGLRNWFDEQQPARQTYIVELLKKMSGDMQEIYLTISDSTRNTSNPLETYSKTIH